MGQDANPLRPTPLPANASMPVPPQQGQPWRAPESALPPFLIRATADLFAQGVADPRGCEYRAVEFASATPKFGMSNEPAEVPLDQAKARAGAKPAPRPSKPHRIVDGAWVLPSEAPNQPRFAVAWNGLLYPLAKLGGAANLEADVQSIAMSAMSRFDKSLQSPHKQKLDNRWDKDVLEPWDATFLNPQTSLVPIKVCMLLRLGRVDLAETLWETGTIQKLQGRKRDLTSYRVSYLSLARDWAWDLFHRTLYAHTQKDDTLALAGARVLALPLIEAKAQAMGFPRPEGKNKPGAYLNFLDQLPDLLADQERRALLPKDKFGSPSLADLREIADQTKRIKALIDRLDEASYTHPINFDRLEISNDAIVKAIIGEGNAAIAPLLDTFEHDNRLTRSCDYFKSGGDRDPRIVPVYEAAYSALVSILGPFPFLQEGRNALRYSQGPDQRAKTAKLIRDYAASKGKQRLTYINITKDFG